MANGSRNLNNVFSFIQKNLVYLVIIITILALIIPIPKTFIDICMIVNIALSIVIILTVVTISKGSDFSSFPQVVLLVTMFGIAINVSSTRLLLTHPVTGSGSSINMSGQSEMVKSFANIVSGNNVVIGFIIFIILIVIQFVITKGASRVAEVEARFTLDSMNSKMFDIQNELNSGAITEEQAKVQKEDLRRENSFYSAMDGSSKFVSGYFKAGIFITVINLIGGFITGKINSNMSIIDTLNSYAKLTIGDGLTSQLPSLLLSFSTGLLVTTGSSKERIDDKLGKEFSTNGTIYIIVGTSLIVMGIVFHNTATILLTIIGGLLIYAGVKMQRLHKKEEIAKKEKENAAKATKQTGSSPDDVSPIVLPDALALDLGYALVPLVSQEKGAELLERVTRIRRESALDLGLVVPQIRIRDNMGLDPSEYSFKIRGIERGRCKLKLGYYMCLNNGGVPKDKELPGERTKDPTFGMDAIWLPENKRAEAEKAGYIVVDPPTVIATHITEIIRRFASEILGRQEVSSIITKLKETNSVVVDEVMSSKQNSFTYGEIERILKNLLLEQVSIRNMVTILETLANFSPITKDPWILTEKVREALGTQICLQYADDEKTLHVLTLSQSLAQKILEHRVSEQGERPFVAFDPVDGRKYINAVSSMIAAVRNRNYLPIILCPAEVRLLVKVSTEREMPDIVVLSVNEAVAAGNEIKIETLGEINID